MPYYPNGLWSGPAPKTIAASKRAKAFTDLIRNSSPGERVLKYHDGEVRLILSERVAVTKTPRKAVATVTPVTEYVGTAEIAERLGVSSSAVSNWIARRILVPEFVLRCGPIFSWKSVKDVHTTRTERAVS